MDEHDFLLTLAEIAIALIAFMNIVVALRQMGGGSLNEFQLLVVMTFSVSGFCATLFALLPILLEYFGIPQPWLWRLSNLPLAATLVSINAWYFHRRSRVAPDRPINVVNYFNLALTACAVGLLVAGSAGIAYDGSIAPYAFGVVALLTGTAVAFIRTLRDFLVT